MGSTGSLGGATEGEGEPDGRKVSIGAALGIEVADIVGVRVVGFQVGDSVDSLVG